MKNNFARKKSEVELRNILLVLSILVVLFRLPLFAVLHELLGGFLIVNDIRAYARYINVLPIVVLTLYAVKESSKKNLNKNIDSLKSCPVSYFFIASIMIGLSYTVIISLAKTDIALMEIIRKFAPHNYFLIFPLLLIYLRFDESDYSYAINRIILPVLLVGGGLLIFEGLCYYYLALFDNKDLYEFIGGYLYLKELNPRPSGILLDSAATSTLLVACICYQYSSLFLGKSPWIILLYVISILLGVIAVYAAASLYPLLIMIIVFLIIPSLTYPRWSIPLVTLSVIFVIILFYGYKYCLTRFAFTNLFNHFFYYFSNIDVFIKYFVPHYTNNFPFFVFPENHLLDYVSGYDLLICIPWLIFIYSPIIKFAKIFSIEKDKMPPLMLCLVFILATAHYSGLEKWGCNYLYSLAILNLFVPSRMVHC